MVRIDLKHIQLHWLPESQAEHLLQGWSGQPSILPHCEYIRAIMFVYLTILILPSYTQQNIKLIK